MSRCLVKACPVRFKDDDGDRMCRTHQAEAPLLLRSLTTPPGVTAIQRQDGDGEQEWPPKRRG